jgi:hypothetical protein
MQSPEELDASFALKSIARNISLKSSLQQMPAVYSVLWSAARRFVTGETRQEGVDIAKVVAAQGYGVSLEYIGENTPTEQACQSAVDEFFALSQAIETVSLPKDTTISLDLSHIGLSVSQKLALELAPIWSSQEAWNILEMIKGRKGPWRKSKEPLRKNLRWKPCAWLRRVANPLPSWPEIWASPTAPFIIGAGNWPSMEVMRSQAAGIKRQSRRRIAASNASWKS